jgi:hypothetical protein
MRDKDRHYIKIKGSLHQEDTVITNICEILKHNKGRKFQ